MKVEIKQETLVNLEELPKDKFYLFENSCGRWIGYIHNFEIHSMSLPMIYDHYPCVGTVQIVKFNDLNVAKALKIKKLTIEV